MTISPADVGFQPVSGFDHPRERRRSPGGYIHANLGPEAAFINNFYAQDRGTLETHADTRRRSREGPWTLNPEVGP